MLMSRWRIGGGVERRLKVDCQCVGLGRIKTDLAPPWRRHRSSDAGSTAARQRQLNGPVTVLDDHPEHPTSRLNGSQ